MGASPKQKSSAKRRCLCCAIIVALLVAIILPTLWTVLGLGLTPFERMHSYMSGKAWAVMSVQQPSPEMLNVAFPSQAAIYWVTALPSGVSARVHGTCPAAALYASLTLYDVSGANVLATYRCSGAEEIDVSYERAGEAASFLIARHYRAPDDRDSVPAVFVSVDVDGSRLADSTVAAVAEKSAFIEGRLHARVSSDAELADRIEARPTNAPLYRPDSNYAGFFPSGDAQYLAQYFEAAGSNDIFRYRGAVPLRVDGGLRYFSIMFVDFATSATLAAIDAYGLGGWGAAYELYLAQTTEAAASVGFDSGNSTHRVMLLSGLAATRPGLIVRTIDISCASGTCSGLAATNAAAAGAVVEAEACRAAMGATYPESEFLTAA